MLINHHQVRIEIEIVLTGTQTNKGKRSVRSLPRKGREIRNKGIGWNKANSKNQSRRTAPSKKDFKVRSRVNSYKDVVDGGQRSKRNRMQFVQKYRFKRQTSNKNKTNIARPKMATSSGAGQSMGLTLVLNADKNKYFMTSAFFEGFKVIISAFKN